MSIGAYFRQKTGEERGKTRTRGKSAGRGEMAAEWSGWLERKEEVERRDVDFDEPRPKS